MVDSNDIFDIVVIFVLVVYLDKSRRRAEQQEILIHVQLAAAQDLETS